MTYPSAGGARLVDPHTDAPIPVLWIRSDSGGSLGLSETFVFDASPAADRVPAFLPYAVLHEGAFTSSGPDQPEPDTWIAFDLAYKYWLTSGAHSPSVALKGTPTRWGIVWREPEPDDAPSPERLAKVRADVHAKADALAASSVPGADAGPRFDSDESLGLVLDAFLELVYAGRAAEAWEFLRTCHADGLGALNAASDRAEVPRTLDALERALVAQIRQSGFIDEILRRNGGSIDPPATPDDRPARPGDATSETPARSAPR